MEFDNNKLIQSITNNQLGDACVDRWRGLRENHKLMMKTTKNKENQRCIMILNKKIK